MRISSGIDIIQISEISELLNSPKKLAKILNVSDVASSSKEHIAGRIALKEAILKATGMNASEWLSIRISIIDSGKPTISFNKKDNNMISIDGSISHHGDYVTAIAVALYDD